MGSLVVTFTIAMGDGGSVGGCVPVRRRGIRELYLMLNFAVNLK